MNFSWAECVKKTLQRYSLYSYANPSNAVYSLSLKRSCLGIIQFFEKNTNLMKPWSFKIAIFSFNFRKITIVKKTSIFGY